MTTKIKPSNISGISITESTGALSIGNGITLTCNTTGTLNVGAFAAFGSTVGTICQGNDSRLSDSRIASDVYSWAKAASKPSYTYTEVGAPSTTGTNASGTWGEDRGRNKSRDRGKSKKSE